MQPINRSESDLRPPFVEVDLLVSPGVHRPALIIPVGFYRPLLEEVNDNDDSMERMRFAASAAPGLDVPPGAASSADGQICPEGEAPEGGSAEKAQCSEQSIEQMNPKTPGWTQRYY